MYEDPAPFKSEAEMCEIFIAQVREYATEWTVYPETNSWDILLVHHTGFQIGIEAKLRLNGKVISQALETSFYDDTGPDCRAVLVPNAASDFYTIAAYIGLTIMTVKRPFLDPDMRSVNGHRFQPPLPKFGGDGRTFDRNWTEMCPRQRLALPEYVPHVAAGIKSPKQLSAWKISAIKIAITLELRGYVTREDFRNHRIDFRRWAPREGGWLAPSPDGFIAGPQIPDFKAEHPISYEEIKKDAPKWMKDVKPVQRTPRLL